MPISAKSSRVSSPNVKIQDTPDSFTPVISGFNDSAAAYDGVGVVVSGTPTRGGKPDAYRVVSTPGSFVGIGQSPVEVRGLTPGTEYTFTATAQTSAGSLGNTSSASIATTPSGSVVLLGTNTSDAQGHIYFTNIPQIYQDLMIVYNGAGGNSVVASVNGDYGAWYSSIVLASTGGSALATATQTYAGFIVAGRFIGEAASPYSTSSVLHIQDYRSNRHKLGLARSGMDYNGSGYSEMIADRYFGPQSSNPITTIDVWNNGGSFTAGTTASLYGIKAVK